ncbi:hypothetical protein GEMRC1_002134 [Eukaryota sp. GEM-RC1]
MPPRKLSRIDHTEEPDFPPNSLNSEAIRIFNEAWICLKPAEKFVAQFYDAVIVNDAELCEPLVESMSRSLERKLLYEQKVDHFLFMLNEMIRDNGDSDLSSTQKTWSLCFIRSILWKLFTCFEARSQVHDDLVVFIDEHVVGRFQDLHCPSFWRVSSRSSRTSTISKSVGNASW